jgi:eukaryotic-like serine/threonine-protein kinase
MQKLPFQLREWTLTEEIGRGGMGIVYEATHKFIKGEFAIKMIKPQLVNDIETRERFLQEASVLANLNHPGIIDTDKPLQEGETLYLPMEYLTGEGFDVVAELHPEGVEPSFVLHLIKQCAEALGYAHEKGVLHRDLKLSNIFLQKNGDIKILDFGLAKGLGDKSMTATGMVVGTPAYVAPEVMKGEKTRPCSDVYSLGIIAFKLLTGKMPIKLPEGESSLWALIGSVIRAHEEGLPRVKELKNEVPENIAAVVDGMLSTNPALRPADGKELSDFIQKLTDSRIKEDISVFDRTRMNIPSFRDVKDSVSVEIDVSEDVVPEEEKEEKTAQIKNPALNVPKESNSKITIIKKVFFEKKVVLYSTVSFFSVIILIFMLKTFSSFLMSSNNPDVPENENNASTESPLSNKSEVSEGMVTVPAGKYFIGCGRNNHRCYDDEKPRYTATLQEFQIMKYEVSVEEYKECVDKNVCPIPDTRDGCNWKVKGREKHPINCVDWNGAELYCRINGMRLPTEEEWEVAAAGKEHTDYVWGNADASCRLSVIADDSGLGCGKGSTWESGQKPMDKSWAGAYDMQGNVREWVSTNYAAYPGGKIDERSKGKKVNRGGSWVVPTEYLNTTHTRGADVRTEKQPDLGFRCAK